MTEEARDRAEKKSEPTPIETPASVPQAPDTVSGRFLVSHIVVEGNKSIPSDVVKNIMAPFEGRELTMKEANAAASRLQDEYRQRGYFITYVYLPVQEIDGTLRIAVIEGRMGNLVIEGNKWFSDETIGRYWDLAAGDLLSYEDMFRGVRRMNENSDRRVRAVLKPGTETGLTDVHLAVEDRFPLHAGYQIDNQGVPSTGRTRHGVTFRSNNFVIPDGVLYGGYVFGRNLGAAFGGFIVPLTTHGTRLVLGSSSSQVRPKREFTPSGIVGTSQTYSATIQQTLYESNRISSTGSLGFDFKDSHTRDISGTSRRDRLRVGHAGLDVTFYDGLGETRLSNEFSFGTGLFGATREDNPIAGRAGAESGFFKYAGGLSRNLEMPYGANMSFKLSTQLSPHRLLPQEQFYLGGAKSVRGYPEGDYLGDQGIVLNVEYSIPFFLIPKEWSLKPNNRALREDIQLFVFLDEGYAKLNGPANAETPSRNLMGAGGGVKVRLAENLSARVAIGQVLGDEPLTESDHTRLHFSVQTEI